MAYITIYSSLQYWMIQYNMQDLTIFYDNKKLKAATIFRKMWALSLQREVEQCHPSCKRQQIVYKALVYYAGKVPGRYLYYFATYSLAKANSIKYENIYFTFEKKLKSKVSNQAFQTQI